MKEHSFPTITKKIILYIVLADLVLCSLVFAVSYWSFNRQFRERTGTTPTAFRNEAREIREQQTSLQTERNRIFETFIPSSVTKNPTS